MLFFMESFSESENPGMCLNLMDDENFFNQLDKDRSSLTVEILIAEHVQPNFYLLILGEM